MCARKMLFVACSVSLSWFALSLSAQEVARKMSKEEATQLTQAVVSLRQSKERELICERLLLEKQKMLKSLISLMEKDHGFVSNQSYTFIASDNTLFQIITNRVAGAKEPERKLVKKFKSKEEAAPLVRLMSARQRTERQILSLAELILENRNESVTWENGLKKKFGLEPSSSYKVTKISDSEYHLIRTQKEVKSSPDATPVKKAVANQKDKPKK